MIQVSVVQGSSAEDFAEKINAELVRIRGEKMRIFSISYSTNSTINSAKLTFNSSDTWELSEGHAAQFITGFIEYDDGKS